MGRFRYLVLIMIILFIEGFASGCATPLAIDYDYDSTYDFGKLKTYDWLPSPPGNQMEDLVEKRVKNAVNTQLAAKGYSQSSESPDFLVALQGVKKITETGSVGVGASIGVPVGSRGSISIGGGKSKPRVKEEGTLILNFIDRQTNTPIWQGSATAKTQPKSSPEEQQRRINEVMANLLSHFPPKPGQGGGR
jgi:hypothetical protein